MIKRNIIFFLFVLMFTYFKSQNTGLKLNDPAPSLVLPNPQSMVQTFNFPYLNKIVLIHFWSSSVHRSKNFLPRALDLFERYNTTSYRSAEGFEVFPIAIQSDKGAWNTDINNLQIQKLNNSIAIKGFNDLYLKNYKLSQLPVTLLVDEKGIIISINPTMLHIEEILDAKKNPHNNYQDVHGKLFFSESGLDMVKNQKLVIMNKFNDTLTRTVTDNFGKFAFSHVKMQNNFIIRVDTTGDLTGKPKAFIADNSGAVLISAEKSIGVYDIKLSSAEIFKLIAPIKETAPGAPGAKTNAISFNANISFKKGTPELDAASNVELDKVAAMLEKNKEYTLEIISHTDSNGDDADNLELSKKRSSAVKNYLVTKEVAPARMKPIGKGETEIKNKCKNSVPCTDVEHAENVRTELKFYK